MNTDDKNHLETKYWWQEPPWDDEHEVLLATSKGDDGLVGEPLDHLRQVSFYCNGIGDSDVEGGGERSPFFNSALCIRASPEFGGGAGLQTERATFFSTRPKPAYSQQGLDWDRWTRIQFSQVHFGAKLDSTDLLWCKNVTSRTRGSNRPFRCLDKQGLPSDITHHCLLLLQGTKQILFLNFTAWSHVTPDYVHIYGGRHIYKNFWLSSFPAWEAIIGHWYWNYKIEKRRSKSWLCNTQSTMQCVCCISLAFMSNISAGHDERI